MQERENGKEQGRKTEEEEETGNFEGKDMEKGEMEGEGKIFGTNPQTNFNASMLRTLNPTNPLRIVNSRLTTPAPPPAYSQHPPPPPPVRPPRPHVHPPSPPPHVHPPPPPPPPHVHPPPPSQSRFIPTTTPIPQVYFYNFYESFIVFHFFL